MSKDIKKNVKVSVIIPVYNVEKTLQRCVDSILGQTLKSIEIVLVNDGSPDGSGLICDDYAVKHENVRVIHKENEGLGPTRNAGMSIAEGEYIYHCDSDDWVEPTLLEDVYLNAKNNNADAVIFGYKIFTEKKGILKEYGEVSAADAEFNNIKKIRNFYIDNLNNAFIAQSACNRIIKRSFIERNLLFFKPFRRSQDVFYSIELFDCLEKLNIISKNYYNYIIEPGKFKSRSFKEMIETYLDVFSEIKKYMVKWGSFDGKNEEMVTTLYASQISNFASFYLIRKAITNKLDIARALVCDERVQKLFSILATSDIKSRFLRYTHYAITRKRPVYLLFIFALHEIKICFSK